jgi:hypothetical protein
VVGHLLGAQGQHDGNQRGQALGNHCDCGVGGWEWGFWWV